MSSTPYTQPMLPAGTFRDQTIVITGGGTGLGRSMGEYLLSLGRQSGDLRAAARGGREGRRRNVRPPAARCWRCNATCASPSRSTRCSRRPAKQFGQIHGLVNNAAGNFVCPTERLSYNAFNSVVDIVLKGTYNCTLAVGKRWIAEGTPGSILNISTTYAWTGSGYVVPSAVAKAGALIMVRSLASEWGKYGIRLNAIAPGSFPTEGAWSRLRPPELGDDST